MNEKNVSQNVSFSIKLQELNLYNFRLFEDIKINFEPQLTVFIGENGAGKTTILDAIARQLTVFVEQLTTQKIAGLRLHQISDIRYNQSGLKNSILIHWKPIGEIQYSGTENSDFKSMNIGWNTVIQKNEAGVSQENDSIEELAFVHKQFKALRKNNYNISIPVLIYYGWDSQSVTFDNNSLAMKTKPTNFDAYNNALSGKGFDYTAFFRWFRWQEQVEMQLKSNPALENVRRAVCSILNTDTEVYTHLHTYWLDDPEGELALDKEGKTFKAGQLSSGEKRLMEIAANIAYRLAIANPNVENPLDGFGIVLIDEIDMHLHPRWQRRVIPQLRKTFPNVQFVVTTHSPLVLQNVKQENVRLLDNGKLYSADETYMRDVNRILNSVMETEETPLKSDLRELFKLLSTNQLEAAVQKRNQLAAIVGSDYPEIYQADQIIQQKKLFAR